MNIQFLGGQLLQLLRHPVKTFKMLRAVKKMKNQMQSVFPGLGDKLKAGNVDISSAPDMLASITPEQIGQAMELLKGLIPGGFEGIQKIQQERYERLVEPTLTEEQKRIMKLPIGPTPTDLLRNSPLCETCGADIDMREEDGEELAFCSLCNEPEYVCMCDEIVPEDGDR